MPDLTLENTFSGLVGGMDEVGRGPWAGPVVAAVVVFTDPAVLPSSLTDAIQDSKKLSKVRREFLYSKLTTLEGCYQGCGQASVDEIDQTNISKATFLAMKRALEALPLTPPTLLIDGKFIPSFPGIKTHPVIKGDDISLSIAAASIIAKVTRDRMMEELAKDYAQYGWEANAGYGTAQHQEALKLYGLTPHHRKSFAPIRKLLENVAVAV